MKRWILALLIVALVVACAALPAIAAGNRGGNFVDADNDGVCDNREERPCGNRGDGFVDADNDGVCDNRENRGHGKGHAHGKGSGGRK